MSTIGVLPTPPDNFSTTLSGGISNSVLTIPLNSVTGLSTEGVGALFKKDANGNVVVGSVELVHWTSLSGLSLILTDIGDRGLTGSDSGAQAYSSGDYFEVWVTSYYFYQNHSVQAYTPNIGDTLTLTPVATKISTVTMPAGALTLAVTGSAAGQVFIVEIINTASQVLTWFSTIKWTDGVVPTLTGTAGKKDVFGFRVTSAGNYDGYIIGQNI